MKNFHSEADEALKTFQRGEDLPAEERLKDADALRTIWRTVEREDDDSSHDRSMVRENLDNAPPFDQDERESDGVGEQFNINSGIGRLIVNEANAGVMEVFTANRDLLHIPLNPQIPLEERQELEDTLSEEVSRMIREWDPFGAEVASMAEIFSGDGVAVSHFNDDNSWEFGFSDLESFKFPRRSSVVSSEVPYCVLRTEYDAVTLWKKVGEEGWEEKEIVAAIKNACKGRAAERWTDWEKIQSDLKNNDLYISSEAKPIVVLVGFVKEFNGQISVYMTTEDGGEGRNKSTDPNEVGFLYTKRGQYDSANELFQIYPYSASRKKSLYSVRGLGYWVFQIANAYDITLSRLLDAAASDAAEIYEATSVEEQEDLAIIDLGTAKVLPPGVKAVQSRQTRGLQNNLIPTTELLSDHLSRLSGGLSEGPVSLGDRASEGNVSLALEQLNKMHAAALELLYPPLDRHWREVVRRIFLRGKDNEASLKMKVRLIERGITPEVWAQIDYDRVAAVRIEGNKSARMSNYRALAERYGSMDDQGRRAFDHDYATEIGGTPKADRYFGPIQRSRASADAGLAQNENALLLSGAEIVPLDGQDHIVHLRWHVGELQRPEEALESGEMDIETYLTRYFPLWEHANKTLDMVGPQTIFEAEVNEYRARLQRMGEFFHNGLKELRNKEQGEEAPEQEAAAHLREEQRKEESHQAKMRREKEQHDLKMAIEESEAVAKLL